MNQSLNLNIGYLIFYSWLVLAALKRKIIATNLDSDQNLNNKIWNMEKITTVFKLIDKSDQNKQIL